MNLLGLGIFTTALTFTYVPQPPVEFHSDTAVAVSFVDVSRVDKVCRDFGVKVPDNYDIWACRIGTSRGGLIVMPNPCTWPEPSDYQQLMCHELGHQNGWRHPIPARSNTENVTVHP